MWYTLKVVWILGVLYQVVYFDFEEIYELTFEGLKEKHGEATVSKYKKGILVVTTAVIVVLVTAWPLAIPGWIMKKLK